MVLLWVSHGKLRPHTCQAVCHGPKHRHVAMLAIGYRCCCWPSNATLEKTPAVPLTWVRQVAGRGREVRVEDNWVANAPVDYPLWPCPSVTSTIWCFVLNPHLGWPGTRHYFPLDNDYNKIFTGEHGQLSKWTWPANLLRPPKITNECEINYYYLLWFNILPLCYTVPFSRYLTLKNVMTMKSMLEVTHHRI